MPIAAVAASVCIHCGQSSVARALPMRTAHHIAVVAASDAEGAINVGSGVPVKVRDVVSAAARAYGKEHLVRYGAIPTRAGDPPFIVADVTRLRALGWSPRFDLERSMQDLAAFYRPWEAYG